MRSWSVGYSTSSYNKSLVLEVGPWYAFVVRGLAEWTARRIPAISLPDISVKIEGRETSLRAKYGDAKRYFRAKVLTPVCHWADARISTRVSVAVNAAEADPVIAAAHLDEQSIGLV